MKTLTIFSVLLLCGCAVAPTSEYQAKVEPQTIKLKPGQKVVSAAKPGGLITILSRKSKVSETPEIYELTIVHGNTEYITIIQEQ